MLSIRTELLAHDNAKVNLAKQIPIDKLFKIEKPFGACLSKRFGRKMLNTFAEKIAI